MLHLLSTRCPKSTGFRADRIARTLAQQSRPAQRATAIADLKMGA